MASRKKFYKDLKKQVNSMEGMEFIRVESTKNHAKLFYLDNGMEMMAVLGHNCNKGIHVQVDIARQQINRARNQRKERDLELKRNKNILKSN